MKKLVFFMSLVLICVAFYSFFGEGLPRFWYDDIWVYTIGGADSTSYSSFLLQIADFTHKDWQSGRVTTYLIQKLYLDFFGDNLYLHRLPKMLAVSFGMCMLAFLLIKEGVDKRIILSLFLFYMTSPMVFFPTIWIGIAGTWAHFFKVLSFFIFIYLYRSEERGLKFYLPGILFLIVMMLGVKAREDFTLAPFVILSFLILKRSRSLRFYLMAIMAVVIVFPYYVFSWGGSGVGSKFHLSNLKMLSVYLGHIAFIVPFVLCSAYIYVKNKGRHINDLMAFSVIWVLFEVGMVFLYQSDEMRYLDALLLATIFFFAGITGLALKEMKKPYYAVFLVIFLLLSGYKIVENVKWVYNFRGSFGSYFIALDKQMKYVNEKYDNSICLYSDFTNCYYDWKTTNRYVNIYPNNVWPGLHEKFYDYNSFKIKDPEKYNKIILLDEYTAFEKKSLIEDVIIVEGLEDTFFDRVQGFFSFNIYNATIYNTKLWGKSIYPVKKGVFVLRQEAKEQL